MIARVTAGTFAAAGMARANAAAFFAADQIRTSTTRWGMTVG
jgi:hypothetical protein